MQKPSIIKHTFAPEHPATDAPAWQHLRPWRNRNPGDLRTLSRGLWAGQIDVDDAPGGPFAVFASRIAGWRALAVCLRSYQDVHGLRTVAGIIGRFAPSLENDTGGYVSLVCGKLGVGPHDQIDAHDAATMAALVRAIALAEGGAEIQWPEDEIAAGLRAAGFDVDGAGGVTIAGEVRTAAQGADALNAAELARVRGYDLGGQDVEDVSSVS